MAECYLIIGLGSIGRRHLRNVRALRPEAKIVLLRREESLAADEDKLADHIVTNIKSAIAHRPIAAIICNPAPFHLSVAMDLAEAGIHLLIEKPISHNLANVDGLIHYCKKKKLKLQTAYVLRYHPLIKMLKKKFDEKLIGQPISAVVECGQYLPQWRPEQDYRQSVSAKAGLGGGVLLELSHEFDYLRYLFGEVQSLSAHCFNSHSLEIDVEDVADLTLRFANTFTANVHLDFLQTKLHRSCKIMGDKGMLYLDLAEQTLDFYDKEGQKTPLSHLKDYDRNTMFIAELEDFLNTVAQNCDPTITGYDGLQAVRIVEAAKQSSKNKKEVTLDG